MQRLVEGSGSRTVDAFPGCPDDWIDEGKSVRVIDVFVASAIPMSWVLAS
jgi:hypothetical protein